MRMDAANRTRTGGSQPHVVIPYCYADHEFACKLAGALRRDRITQWIDEVDMSAGVFLVNRVFQAARPVDVVIPAISASSIASGWIQHELRTVMARSFNGRPVRVLPAKIDGTALPGFIASLPYFDFHGDGWSRAYDELMVAVQQRPGPRAAGGPTATLRLPRPARLT